jgi:HSP20 family protein
MTDKNSKSRRPDEDTTALAVPGLGFPSIFEDFMRPFDELMKPIFPTSMKSFWSELREREPTVDLQDRGSHYLLTAELPGFEKKDLEVKVDSNVLEVRAEKSTDSETKGKEGSQRQRSRSYFHRYMTLPEEVVSEKVNGTMKNGVLEVKLPKRAPKIADKSRRVDLK